MFNNIFQPKWARKMPIHLRPSADQVARIESLRKDIALPHDKFFTFMMGHPITTEKSLQHTYELAKTIEPDKPEQALLAEVLLQRLGQRAMLGFSTFGVDFDGPPENLEEQANHIVSSFSSIGELAAWIVQQEDATDLVIPPEPEHEWALEEITDILSEGTSSPSGEERINAMISYCQTTYSQSEKAFPDADPHQHLIVTMFGLRQMEEPNFRDKMEKDEDFAGTTCYYEGISTRVCACLPPPLCAKALAYMLILKGGDRSALAASAQHYQEYIDIMQPVYQAFKNGTYKELYCKFNQNLENQSLYTEHDLSFEECYSFLPKEEIEEHRGKNIKDTQNKLINSNFDETEAMAALDKLIEETTRREEAAKKAEEENAVSPAPLRETILIVEDNDELREIMVQFLRNDQPGLDVETASDGVEALDKIAVRAPAVLITNIVMPKMDGIALLKTLHEKGISLPTLVTSGYWNEAAFTKKLAEEGIVPRKTTLFLKKPFIFEQLGELLNQLREDDLSI